MRNLCNETLIFNLCYIGSQLSKSLFANLSAPHALTVKRANLKLPIAMIEEVGVQVWPWYGCVGDYEYVMMKVVKGFPWQCEIWIFQGDCEEAIVSMK